MPAERTSHEVETGVAFEVDTEGCVLVEGERVLGASHTKPVRVQRTAEVMCQRCKVEMYPVPVELHRRFETAVGFNRLFYWFGVTGGYPRRCPSCRAKEAATP